MMRNFYYYLPQQVYKENIYVKGSFIFAINFIQRKREEIKVYQDKLKDIYLNNFIEEIITI